MSIVFPTGVGVNRGLEQAGFDSPRFPHRRGGEPWSALALILSGVVFPTGVGVNRCSTTRISAVWKFSPQAWG